MTPAREFELRIADAVLSDGTPVKILRASGPFLTPNVPQFQNVLDEFLAKKFIAFVFNFEHVTLLDDHSLGHWFKWANDLEELRCRLAFSLSSTSLNCIHNLDLGFNDIHVPMSEAEALHALELKRV